MQQIERKDYRQRVLNTGDILGRGWSKNLMKSLSSNYVHHGVCSTTTQLWILNLGANEVLRFYYIRSVRGA